MPTDLELALSTIYSQGAVLKEPLRQEAGPRRWCHRQHRSLKQATTTTTTGTGQSGLSGEARQATCLHVLDVCVQLSRLSVRPIKRANNKFAL